MERKVECLRCETINRKPGIGTRLVHGPNGLKSLICDKCWEEIEFFVYENQENEEVS